MKDTDQTTHIFGREHLKVNKATQDAIIHRYNTQPELYESLELLYNCLVDSGHIDNIAPDLVDKVEKAIEAAQSSLVFNHLEI